MNFFWDDSCARLIKLKLSIMKTEKLKNNSTDTVIKNLTDLLNKGNAHVSLDDSLKDISFDLIGKKPKSLPYSIWQLVEHIRIAQNDILEYSRNKNHISPAWPDDYWASKPAPESNDEWNQSIEQIKSDREEFIKLLSNSGENIYHPFDYGNGQSLLKEALVLADHNSYHTAEIIIIRRLLDDWKK
jgi:uncharacterized damage-inducible protein DinB